MARSRVNEEITAPVVDVFDAHGHFHRAVPIASALKMAKHAGLDLVEINPYARTPVCRIERQP